MTSEAQAQSQVKADWVIVVLTLVSLAAGTIAASYSIFETKEASKERSSRLEDRLDRIEAKLDRALDYRKTSSPASD